MRPVPFTTDGLLQYLGETFAEVEQRLDACEKAELMNLVEIFEAPDRPRNGDIVFADGTEWDPGSGRGLYTYNGNTSAWVQLLSLP